MEHLVRYELESGETKYDTVQSLEAAINLVERLRNEAGTSNVEVFRHVPIEFKTYYKVVVADEELERTGSPQSTPTPSSEGDPPPGSMPLNPPAQPKVQVHDAPDDQSEAEQGNGGDGDGKRSSLFSRG
ncbi:MAG: hypothetical protein R3343_02325 [Nitriliruptorales bacterium]|nr:hypothetical protein [Nitriliruptorales bacterium]